MTDDSLKKYRESLSSARQKAQEEFDKNVLWLSSGGLGVSFTFLKDLILNDTIEYPWLLLSAWVCWFLSILSIFFSYRYSYLGLDKTIKKIDDGTVHDNPVETDKYFKFTAFLNKSGVCLLFAGLFLILLFSYFNFHNKGVISGREKTTSACSSPIERERGEGGTCKGTIKGQSDPIDGGVYTRKSNTETVASIRRLNERLDFLEIRQLNAFEKSKSVPIVKRHNSKKSRLLRCNRH